MEEEGNQIGQTNTGVKRTILMRDEDLHSRLSSKKDWFTYLG